MINYYPEPEGGGAKNDGFQSTIDIHILNIFQLTVDIHFKNAILLPLSRLLRCLQLPNCEGSHSVRLYTFSKFILDLVKTNIWWETLILWKIFKD